MNAILVIPMEIRLAAIFALGSGLGALVNLGAYRLAWHPRAISPWSPPSPDAPPRRLADRLPIIGWLGLRREADLHGPGFWLRPLAVELLAGCGFAALYYWEIDQAGLLPLGFPLRPFPALPAAMHGQYLAQVILITFMLVSSLIDVDEQTIPDAVTVPGTLVGLALAAVYPWSLLPDARMLPHGQAICDFLYLTSPNAMPPWLGGFSHNGSGRSLAIGLACFLAWCAALLPLTCYGRHGWRRALELCLARLVRSRATYCMLGLALAGSAAIATVWFWAGPRWNGLLTALVGMATGGAVIWLVRIVGTAALRREAMGFGDVTLVAMIGAFLGWQSCLIVFFLAPLAGALVVGGPRLVRWLTRGIAGLLGLAQTGPLSRPEMPYGPFLCLAALATIVGWAALWDWAIGVFSLGWLVPLMMLGCLLLMAPMLLAYRLIKFLAGKLLGDTGRKTA